VLLPDGLNVLSGVNLGLGAQLNALEQKGQAVILSEPQLSARNGSEAYFLAGGELPYTVSSINGPSVLFKPYGIRLTIRPRVNRGGAIRATVDSEVSSIDNSISTPSGPALLTRQTKTEFNVLEGETIVLSGLISREQSKDVDQLPLLGNLPIIGALFRSKRFRNRETELVVFVTPRVVDSKTPDLVDRVNRTQDRLGEQLGPAPYLTSPLQPGREAGQAPLLPAPRTAGRPSPPAPGPSARPAPAIVPAPSPESPPEPEPPVQLARIYLVSEPGLALRTEPSPGARVEQRLRAGMRLVPISTVRPIDGHAYVLAHDGRTVQQGWVELKGLSPQAD
jgi:pilus assembly protein CpaC